MSEFIPLLKERRSANKFIPGVEILDKELEEMFQLVKFAKEEGKRVGHVPDDRLRSGGSPRGIEHS
ncbi:hypothetical protein [Paenibacillus rigui]|uniref:hypothetical protein n=1 Tax=Paenibacillus rigui TaxID=554312 RepID=UPI0026D30182